MDRIDFSKLFLTGHPGIDADHRLIIDAVNGLSKAIQDKNCGLCRARCDHFFESIESHFGREELILEELGFPHLDEHRESHRNLQEKVMTLKGCCLEIRAKNNPCPYLDDLLGIVIADFVKYDNDFKSFLDWKGFSTGELPSFAS